jgi:hypothetical protein
MPVTLQNVWKSRLQVNDVFQMRFGEKDTNFKLVLINMLTQQITAILQESSGFPTQMLGGGENKKKLINMNYTLKCFSGPIQSRFQELEQVLLSLCT